MQISKAESQVMQFLWDRHPATASDIFAALGSANDWSEATVKTLLNRLKKKGAVATEPVGKRFLYRPAIEREAWLLAESSHFIDRLFDGRLAPLVSHFSSHGRLSQGDLNELRELIERLEDEH
ncbi:MAG: BlaI/MecI/CopY family transcriptional regulator [Wenzhouxiangellaceae bacterium]|nr:BlaI/MecI/CopY family transcriptional regulator [Wenzhouxiangellaceae bacterium]MBS3747114.1 BlaI/MecI/CopY family transcriptional regulator [Wenzhouxiangellaceae bacterium]MBS3822494.1 BlaI/MecI/CopY family transcriptional regulator [Wenzhouxiangellaceae bacterium]